MKSGSVNIVVHLRELCHDFYLSGDVFGESLVDEHILDVLDCELLACSPLLYSHNVALSTLSKVFLDLVFGADQCPIIFLIHMTNCL